MRQRTEHVLEQRENGQKRLFPELTHTRHYTGLQGRDLRIFKESCSKHSIF